jgi:hypothetical protein
MIFMALGIYEKTHGRYRLHTVAKSAHEESEESEKFHFMKVEVKAFQFLAEPTVPHLP